VLTNVCRPLVVFSAFQFIFLAPFASAAVVEQWFPAQFGADKKTAWRISWAYTHPEPNRPESNVLYISKAEFKRSPDEDYITVASDLRLSEIFVPYANGERILDITDFEFDLIEASLDDAGPACIIRPEKLDKYAIKEVHDDGVRWRGNHEGRERVLRGQKMVIWATLDAGNYRYMMEYGFHDDGTITCRLGATGHNLVTMSHGKEPHHHTGCWRIEMHLGDPRANQVKLVQFRQNPGDGGARVFESDVNEGLEGSALWIPSEFTTLRIENIANSNTHVGTDPRVDPNNRIRFDVMPLRWGTGRTNGADDEGERFTHFDFWVTVAKTDSSGARQELTYRDVPDYVNGERLADQPIVIWHNSPVHHVPRVEDFGREGFDPRRGVALTMWGGFQLRPRNFFDKTPLFP
jgi:primary-amine oxidase